MMKCFCLVVRLAAKVSNTDIMLSNKECLNQLTYIRKFGHQIQSLRSCGIMQPIQLLCEYLYEIGFPLANGMSCPS